MTKPLLSICIATYNRAEYIGETLESIIPQITDEVEIVIVDGASTDDTSAVVKSYMEACKQIRYIRLPSKGGIDQDYCTAVEHAQGAMCWLFPDDDILKPGAISYVLNEIQNNYALIIVNGEMRNADLSVVLEARRIEINDNKVFKPNENEELLTTIAHYVTFIGCVVIKRDLWIAREKKKYFGTEFIHVGVIFQRPLPADTLLIAPALITIRYGNAKWSSRAFQIWMFKYPNLIWSFAGISESAKRQVCLRNPWQRLNNLVILRSKGAYTLKEYRVWIKPRLRSVTSRFMARFVAQFPGFIINPLSIVYTLIFYRLAKGTLLDFINSRFYYVNILRRLFRKT